jgi:pimeloyl-ACP methyl ester carboxylesterase
MLASPTMEGRSIVDDTQSRECETDAVVPDELRALGVWAFDELRRFPLAIAETHLGIAERAFRGTGVAGRPAKLIHDAVAGRAYRALGQGASALGKAADGALERSHLGERIALSGTPSGAAAIAALNGWIGDRLEREGSSLAQPTSVRIDGHPVDVSATGLRDAFPDAGGQLVVFLHGLIETEFSWRWGGDHTGSTYGSRLEQDLGSTAVFLRYNSGLHISENGRSVAALIDELVRAWPVEVERIALVGHSMGGLVARSACHRATEESQDWVRRVRHVVSLGTPHLGAPLEQGAHVAAVALHRLPETRMLSGLLRRRSAGIRDLRQGSLVDEDWQGRDPEALRAVACKEVPLLPGATHCFVSATLTRDRDHPLGRLLGDILVLAPSASGQGRARRIPFREEDGHHVGGTHHLALLNHPEVYDRLCAWLAAGAVAA